MTLQELINEIKKLKGDTYFADFHFERVRAISSDQVQLKLTNRSDLFPETVIVDINDLTEGVE